MATGSLRLIGWATATMLALTFGCSSDSSDTDGGGDAGMHDGAATADASADVAATLDVAASDDAGADAADALPDASGDLPRAMVTGTIFNDSAATLTLPSDLTFRAAVVGDPSSVVDAVWNNDLKAFTFTLPQVTVGAQQIEVREYGPDHADVYDLFQASSRLAPVSVTLAGDATVDVHVKWHWQQQPVAGTADVHTCLGARQIRFRDATHGLMAFPEDAGLSGVTDLHGGLFGTSDGGRTWTVVSATVLDDGGMPTFVPSSTRWFGTNGGLMVLPGTTTYFSVGENGVLARSTDDGKTWTRLGYRAPTWGPGGFSYAGVVRSGSSLYVGAITGGVQGSAQVDSIARSTNGGDSWQVILSHCDRPDTDACAAGNRNDLPMGFAGVEFGCGPAGHCVSIGPSVALSTTDDFATFTVMSVMPPGFACSPTIADARVVWLPGTSTGWMIAASSACGSPTSLRRITTDGGATWADWAPSPVSQIAGIEFADAQNGFFLEGGAVNVTHDGGVRVRSTGPAPGLGGTSDARHLAVADATHAWVTSTVSGACNGNTTAMLAIWQP